LSPAKLPRRKGKDARLKTTKSRTKLSLTFAFILLPFYLSSPRHPHAAAIHQLNARSELDLFDTFCEEGESLVASEIFELSREHAGTG
jgi:hypothetical protein